MSDRHELYTTGMGGTVQGLAFFQAGASFAAALGYFERDQVQFRTSDGEPIAIIRDHWGTVWSVATSASGAYLATSGADSRVIVYNSISSPILDLPGHQDDVVAVTFSPDSTLIASAGFYDRHLLVHHLPDGALYRNFDAGSALLHGVSFSPDGRFIAAAAEEWPVRGRIDIFRLDSGTLAARYTEGTSTSIGCIAYSPDGSALAFGRADGVLAIAAPPACYPNCDNSTAAPTLNVNDFSCFLNRFAAGDPYANCDGSATLPNLNVLDFTCFLNAFAAGCP
jgi:WD40 repeat protein